MRAEHFFKPLDRAASRIPTDLVPLVILGMVVVGLALIADANRRGRGLRKPCGCGDETEGGS